MDLPTHFYIDEEDDDENDDDVDDHYISSNNGGTSYDDSASDSSFSSEGNSDHEHEYDLEKIEREKREFEERSLQDDAAILELRQKNKELEESMKKMEERMKQLLAQKKSLSKTTSLDDEDDDNEYSYQKKEIKSEDTMSKLDKLLNLVEQEDVLDKLLKKHSGENQTPFMSKIFLEQQRVDHQKVLKNDDQWAKQKRLERERELRSISNSTGDVRSQWESRTSNPGNPRKTIS